jgi:predicted nuclease with TOPRIM domain
MTQSQREMFLGLQSTVEEAGARLRDLLMEYQTVNERLNMLRQQHSDLEEEYTRLVEQQLGE